MASKKKKIISKDDLRQLMKATKTTVKGSINKVNHPLAKYNSLNQLVCSLCNQVVKTDLLWPTHLQSRPHKEKVEALRQQKESGESVGIKRKSSSNGDSGQQKKLKGDQNSNNASKGLPADFFEGGGKVKLLQRGMPTSTFSSTSSLLAQYGSSDSEDEDVEMVSPGRQSSTSQKPSTSAAAKSVASGLPADFFDSGAVPTTSSSKEEDEEPTKPSAMADILPEGFFDDPKQDAKVRKVEYVDKMEEEWELFQRSMKEETHVSEAIIEEEDEQVNVDRNIDEIDEQIQCWKEVNELETKKEEMMKNGPVSTRANADSDDELNEEMLDEFLDWRSKKSWR